MANEEKKIRMHQYRIRLNDEEWKKIHQLRAARVNIPDLLRSTLISSEVTTDKHIYRNREDTNRIYQYAIRLNDEEWEKLQQLKAANMNIADILWNALETAYNENCAPTPKLTHTKRLGHLNNVIYEKLLQFQLSKKESV